MNKSSYLTHIFRQAVGVPTFMAFSTNGFFFLFIMPFSASSASSATSALKVSVAYNFRRFAKLGIPWHHSPCQPQSNGIDRSFFYDSLVQDTVSPELTLLVI
jgi:hypothetical protein